MSSPRIRLRVGYWSALIWHGVLALALLSTPAIGLDVKGCGLNFCLYLTGIPCFVERNIRDNGQAVLHLAGLARASGGRAQGSQEAPKVEYAVTSRGPLEYFDLSGLFTYDFRGKQILDIAAGKSRFAQMVNLVFGRTGTRATALDLNTTAPYWSGNTPWVKGDAFAMPFQDKTFDLTLNNWMFLYLLSTQETKGVLTKEIQNSIQKAIEEQLRVTADGGEARIGLGLKIDKSSESLGLRYLQEVLAHHPRVESVSFVKHFPGNATVIVKMKENSGNQHHASVPGTPVESLPLVPWKTRGMAAVPAVYAATAVGLLAYRFLNDPIANANSEELEKLSEKFPKITFEVAKTSDRQDRIEAVHTLRIVNAWLSRIPPDARGNLSKVVIVHDGDSRREGDVSYISSRSPDFKALLERPF